MAVINELDPKDLGWEKAGGLMGMRLGACWRLRGVLRRPRGSVRELYLGEPGQVAPPLAAHPPRWRSGFFGAGGPRADCDLLCSI